MIPLRLWHGGKEGGRVIVRVDLNVPINGGQILDDFRIKKALPFIESLMSEGRRVVLLSHLSGSGSLLPVYNYLKRLLPHIDFSPVMPIDSRVVNRVRHLPRGGVFLCENVRHDPGETTNSYETASRFASLGDVFVNNAFSVAHRMHASVSTLPSLLPSYAGPLFVKEITELTKVFTPPHPFYVIMGGAKFKTKFKLVNTFLNLADKIFLCGALAHQIYHARGLEVGRSLLDRDLSVDNLAHDPRVVVPNLVLVENESGQSVVKEAHRILPNERIVDASSEFVGTLEETLSNARFVLWNGPLGDYEHGFEEATEQVARIVAKLKAYTIVGGGDTLAAIKRLNVYKNINFVSTGGGAMLAFLARENLPGIEVLLERSNS